MPAKCGDAKYLRSELKETQAIACILPSKNRKAQFEYDTNLYNARNIVECMFNGFKIGANSAYAYSNIQKPSSPSQISYRQSFGERWQTLVLRNIPIDAPKS